MIFLRNRLKVTVILLFSTILILAIIFYSRDSVYSKGSKQQKVVAISKVVKSDANKNNSLQCFFAKSNQMNFIKLYGTKNKFGFTNEVYRTNEFTDTTLYLWGNNENILNRKLKITASNGNGNTIDIGQYQTSKEGHIKTHGEKNTISTAMEELSVKIPSKGTWQLNVYIDNNLVGKINIEVEDKSNYYL